MKFPIYRVEFDLYVDGVENPIQCRQDIMLMEEYPDHLSARVSLYRMATSLADRLDVHDKIVAWDGCIYLDRMDTWCLHYDSHYTYRRFDWNPMDDFLEYCKRHPEELEGTMPSDYHVCGCETCKKLNRTMILHLGKDECPTCSSVS